MPKSSRAFAAAFAFVAATSATFQAQAWAQSAEDEIVVRVPGPELWRVYDGDSEVFILASIDALPRESRWNSSAVRSVLDRANRLYVAEGVSVGAGDLARLLITRRDAFRNPDGASLLEYLPAPLATRLRTAADAQSVDLEDLQLWRPYIAGGNVLDAALENAGLSQEQDVVIEARRLARRAGVRVSALDFVDAGPLIDALNDMPLGADNACLALQLDSIERQVPALRARAEAWAQGDVEALRAFSSLVDPDACLQSLGAARLNMRDVERRYIVGWRQTIAEALRRPGVSLAVVSVDLLLKPAGVLDELAAAGHQIEGP